MSFTGACGVGVSDVYMLKSVGDSTPPCGTPLLNWRCVDVLYMNMLYACCCSPSSPCSFQSGSLASR